MPITLRSADAQDFEYCARLYFGERKAAIQESDPDVADLRRRWEVEQVRLIALDGSDVGWLQCALQNDALFVVQLFIDAPFQGRGIGTEVLDRVVGEGRALGRATALGVLKTNPALRLYARLGFVITHEDDRKFYMRRDLDPSPN